jgi:hypothetical protein
VPITGGHLRLAPGLAGSAQHFTNREEIEMAEWRKFAATNDPGTCLWCGHKLRRRISQPKKPAGMEWEEWWASPQSQERTPAYGKGGDYGDGFFCGLRCAYQFAVRLAELGRRLEDIRTR